MKHDANDPRIPAIAPDVTEALVAAVTPIDPAPARAAAMRRTLLARAATDRQRFVTVRNGDGVWVPLAPKVALKMLDDDGAMQTFLLKLDAGGSCPAHDHPGDESCIVLEGDCRLGDMEFEAGDYHVARAGTRHGGVSTRGGCVLFIRVPSGMMPRI
jgi:quercetin dioxygenase-like cupin family protein